MMVFKERELRARVARDLRRFIVEGSFASQFTERLGAELHYQLVEGPADDDDLWPPNPVKNLFELLGEGWQFDPLWLANQDDQFLLDDGSPLPSDLPIVLSHADQLAAYGLWLVGSEIEVLGPRVSAGDNEQGFSSNVVDEHRTACLLYGYLAMSYAHELLSTGVIDREAIERGAREAAARRAATARHANDPKQLAKRFVRDCWSDWNAEPSRYATTTAFARDMLDKQPALASEAVIARWVRTWTKGTY